MSRRAAVLVGLALVILAVNGLVVQKELLLRQGTSLFLELAPVDPRSLIQGDYMRLDYRITRDLEASAQAWPRDGRLVVLPDPRGVARFVRRDQGEPLQEGQRYLRYRRRGAQLLLGAESFLFQEGQADRFSGARYAELKVTSEGDAVLAGLRDEDLRPLGEAAGSPGPVEAP